MKLIRLTSPQASFLEIEVVGRHADDDANFAEVAALVGDHLQRSESKTLQVPDGTGGTLLEGMIVDALNALDDENEGLIPGDAETRKLARGAHRAGSVLLEKVRKATR